MINNCCHGIGAIILFGGLQTNCSSLPVNSNPMSRKLTINDSGGHLIVKLGDVFNVSLDGNLSTGYQWLVTDLDEKYLIQQAEKEYSFVNKQKGAGEITLFTFKAIQKGEAQLTINYQRSFELDAPPVYTFFVIIDIQ